MNSSYERINLDLSVIILTGNEQIHIKRCLQSASLIAAEIFVVDSFSADNTVEVAKQLGAKIFLNKWENNYAKQFNWALTNLPIKTKWVLRLDADEYLTAELVAEIKDKLLSLPDDVSGIVFPLKRIFLGRNIRYGVGRVMLLRLFKPKKAACEQRLMDEHIQLLEGHSVEFENEFVDHNLNDLAWWTTKHNGYALREALDMLDIELGLLGHAVNDSGKLLGDQAQAKRLKKHRYVKMPLFWRSALYFFVRYVLKGGFLDGKEGFLWHFLQGWWYRTLVDSKIFEIKKACGDDVEKIKSYLLSKYQIDCNKQNPFDKE
ncbi:MAG: glycosyltransferase family 2 protein [Kiritimatiellae bacterium]|nr:glycosyltransferase family 2 protein [Kiritimatiellia bacterium]